MMSERRPSEARQSSRRRASLSHYRSAGPAFRERARAEISGERSEPRSSSFFKLNTHRSESLVYRAKARAKIKKRASSELFLF